MSPNIIMLGFKGLTNKVQDRIQLIMATIYIRLRELSNTGLIKIKVVKPLNYASISVI